MKKRLIVFLVCILLLLLIVVLSSYSFNRIYVVNIDNLYNKLQYEGNKFIPVIEELCTKEGFDYLRYPEAIETDRVSVLGYVPPLSLDREINYMNVFLVTNYIKIY
ncbi:MAG: hypothetical protein Q8N73_02685 [bacterium]|nr:hypothetical protein [bacterium]